MLKKNLAGFFAVFLGMFGVHRFYLGQQWRGMAQFAGFWFVVFLLAETGGELPFPFIMAALVLGPIITGLIFWATPYEKWAKKYDPEALQKQYGYQTPASLPAGKSDLPSVKKEGVRYYRSGDYDLAVEAFEEAADLAPTDPVVHFNLACCYSMLGQYPRALRQLELALTFNLPKPERVENHPALEDLRRSNTYATFRQNNYRRMNLLDLTGAGTETVNSVLEPEEILEGRGATEEPVTRRTAPPPPQPQGDLLEQITRLRELHDAGILTEKEYAKQREKLLG